MICKTQSPSSKKPSPIFPCNTKISATNFYKKMNSIAKQNLFYLFSFAILSLTFANQASATDSPGFGSVIVDDVKYEATAPSRWDNQDWKELGWAGLAVAGTAI